MTHYIWYHPTKLIILGILLLICNLTRSQNTTEDLLRSKRVHDFIYLRPDFGKKQLFYQIDRVESKRYNKVLKKNLLLSMSESDEDLNIICDYFNPFKFDPLLADSVYLDENFASLGKFMESVAGLVSSLNSVNTGLSGKAASANSISELKCPDLTQWKFDFQVGSISKCKPDISSPSNSFFLSLSDIDNKFYDNGENKFENQVKTQLTEILNCETLSAFKIATAKLKDENGKLETRNTESQKAIVVFENQIGVLNLSQDSGRTEACSEFLALTVDIMRKILTNVKAIQVKREMIVKEFKSMQSSMEAFSNSGDSVNTVMIGTYTVNEENVTEIRLKFRSRDVKIENDILTSSIKDEVLSKNIYLRAYRTLIPEFSVGIFYTNLSYQNYTTKQVGDSVQIINGGVDKYPAVEAAHLNLIFNVFHGSIKPMVQAGIGTAKDRPSLLLGGGIRFTKPKRLAITYGRIWTWKKEFTNYKVDDKISDNAVLEKDLKYTLTGKSNYYIGIQLNF